MSLMRSLVVGFGLGIPAFILDAIYNNGTPGFTIAALILGMGIIWFTDWPDVSRFTSEKRITEDHE